MIWLNRRIIIKGHHQWATQLHHNHIRQEYTRVFQYLQREDQGPPPKR